MKIYAIVGQSHVGKTWLIRRLIPELKARGRSVAVIKHCHQGFALDLEGKDSWQFMQAGSERVAMWSPDQVAVLQKTEEGLDARAIAKRFFLDVDFVFVEGGRQDTHTKKIEVLRKGISEKVESPPEELIAVVADLDVAVDRPVYHPDHLGDIAHFLERTVEATRSRVDLYLNGASVPLNAFAQKIFENVVLGMVASLKGVKENPQYIILTIERKKAEDEKL